MLVTPEAGDKIADRYLLQEPVGTGGMGVVWLAWDERLERRVAVKCARLDDDRAARRLMGEARNSGRLHHPNIVGVFDFVDEGSTCWIIMEYVPSRSLAQIMTESGPLTPEEAGSIGCQIADALAKSHGEGVVHGDVTPENILVTDEGVAKLTDFGISRALWNDVTHSTTGSVRGKPRYLAPELAKGRPAGEKSDVFSLGASLFAAVEGQSPYGEAEHPMAYLARALEGHIEPMRRAGPLDGPLTALLEVEPRHRPDAAKARKLLTHAAPPPRPVQEQLHDSRTRDLTSHTFRLPRLVRRVQDFTPFMLPLPRPVRRRRLPLAITAVALVTAGAITVGLVLYGPWAAKDKGGRTGVPDAKPSATGRAGTIGDERTADPCGLLDAASLSRFGDTALDPAYGEIDRCDVLVRNNSGDDNADVQVNLDSDRDDFDDIVSSHVVRGLTVVTLKRDGRACVRAVLTADGKQIRVIGKQLYKVAPDPCHMADAATDRVVGVLAAGPVPRRSSSPAANSLARLNTCTLLDAAELKRLPGVTVGNQDRGFGSWDCEWSSDDGNRGVEIQFSRDNSLDADDGTLVDVAGTKSYFTANDVEDDSCTVRTPHRSYTDSAGERTTELFELTVYAPNPTKQLCDTATEFATVAVRNIAKQLPEQ
ncbi:Serine/threonine protein kinase [Streptomyces sp. Ag82_O1-12]|uniref:serine/threonine-protein kinase n=1 Tax=unclassified Streptomyces TaxID=2593676 RepID=UPI000BCAA2D1|nr:MULTISPECIES: serine/threonine-protein kinase [unclassified Streptomyces]SMQ14593.1 Serine/threonine protein kinase [Streptomyces sp. Ag82_O1-12]SOD43620.1 Serine/threonine protein kinase [Streptomyces sp. Ag82_G6-1]